MFFMVSGKKFRENGMTFLNSHRMFPVNSHKYQELTEFIHQFKKKTRPQLSKELFLPKAFGTNLKGFFFMMKPV
jgi:hypothetical protein